MSDLNLRVITTDNPDLLEKSLCESSQEDLRIKRFSAKHNSARNHYEITICISDCHAPHLLINQLATKECIRELTPIKNGSLT